MKQAKHFRRILSFLLVVAMLLSMTVVGMVGAFAAEDGPTLTYSFKYDNAGYAEGRVRLTASSELDYDKYTLYWADDTKALDGYAPITTINLNQESRSFTFGKHTAIPADATKLIAVESALAVGSITVDMADAVYDIPAEKQFKYSSADKEYTFQTLSDIHFHRDGYEAYQYADEHFTSALNAAQLRGAEFVATCGDNTNYGDAKEWGQYLATIANSNFTGPVFEVNGNHEPYNEALGSTAHKNILDQYKIATGLDTVTDKMRSELYYEVTAQNGDHHIFMALELVNKEFSPKISDNFSKEQMDWLEGLLNKYKNDGKKIFIYEHAPFTGYGAGDNKVAPHYTAAMTIDQATYPQTYRFKELLESNKDIVWFSGHTHIDFKYNYNIDNENGTTAYTVHVPSTASSTTVNAADNGLIYEAKADSAQGYFVDVYADATVLNGTDLVKNEILPLYTYLVDYSGEKLIENDVEAGEEVNYSKVVVTVDASVFNAKSVKVTLYGADDETLSQSVTMLQDADGLYKANVSTQFTKMKFVVTTDKYTISSAEYKVADSKTVLGAYKISYDNEYGWSNVNVYAWNTAGGELATWPGVAMTQEADGTYTAVIPNFPNMIIFNNGTGQTDDLEIAPYIAEKIEGSYTVNTTPTPPVEDAPVEPEVPVETTTIYFEKPDSWKGAYIYGFYGEVGQTAEKIWPKDYPGASMNLVDGNTYKCDVPVDIDYIKFCDGDNNGTNYRTDNISGSNISEGAVFSITGQGSKYWNWTVTAADIASVGAGVTTYVINSAKWDTVAAYYWDGASVDWPGTAMTKTGETVNGFDVYSVTISAAPKNIIFNNNNNGSQTDDLTFVADQYYDVKSGQWYATLADVPAVDTASTDRYLVGSFNGWSTVKNEFRLKAAGDAVAYVELELDANTEYEFKIIREGTWTSSKSAATTITGDVEGLTFSSSVSENTKMKTTEAGTYVFAFGISTSQLAITYPAAETPDTPDVPEEPTTEPTPEIPTEPECPTTPDGDLDIPADTKTIYFTNVENWANVYVYGFYGVEGQAATGEPLGTYPGTQMTFLRKNSQGQDIYTAEIPADIDYLKFSDGAATNERTNNIPNAKFEGEINGFYLTEKVSGKWNIDVYTYVPEPKPPVSTEPTTELTTEPTTEATVDEPTTEEKTDIPTTKTIYFTNNENWANVYVYGFYGVEGQAATGEPLGTYPGTQMTFCRKNSQGQDIYTAEIPADVDYLKFSDGSATNERTNNIPNATFAGDINGFYLTEKVSGKWNIDVYTYVPEPKPPVSTEPTTELTTEATVDEPTTAPTTETTEAPSTPVVTKKYLYGDVDMDTRVTVKDATAIQKHAAELMMITDIALAVADVDGNGSVNVKDATAIQKFAAELIEGFIAGEYYEVEEEGTTDSTDPTDPTDKPEIIENDLTKLLATVKNTLANENYYASYVAYAGLKKAYFNYKDANIAAMSDADIDAAVVEINVALVAYNTMKQNNPKHVNGYQAPKAGTYLLRGTMNNWDESGVMEKDGDGVSITYTLAAGEQKLKVYDVDTGKWYGNGGTFTDSCDGWTMSDTAGDLAFTATGGTYKFTVKFDGAKVKLSVAKIG